MSRLGSPSSSWIRTFSIRAGITCEPVSGLSSFRRLACIEPGSARRSGCARVCVAFRNRIAKASQHIKAGVSDLADLPPPTLNRDGTREQAVLTAAAGVDIEECVRAYDRWLRSFFGEHGRILAMPEVTHHELVEAVLAKRKPFTAGDYLR